jgi:hypothetical protein
MDRYESGPVLSATPRIALSDPGAGFVVRGFGPKAAILIRRCTRLRLITAPCSGQSESRALSACRPVYLRTSRLRHLQSPSA